MSLPPCDFSFTISFIISFTIRLLNILLKMLSSAKTFKQGFSFYLAPFISDLYIHLFSHSFSLVTCFYQSFLCISPFPVSLSASSFVFLLLIQPSSSSILHSLSFFFQVVLTAFHITHFHFFDFYFSSLVPPSSVPRPTLCLSPHLPIILILSLSPRFSHSFTFSLFRFYLISF